MALLAALQGIFVLLLSFLPENNGQQTVTLLVEFHTNVSLPCSCSIHPEITNLVQWYRSSNASNTRAIAWWGRGKTGNSPGFGINDDFSMAIERVNLTNQGLYRCFVASVGGVTEHTCYVKLDVYANPYSFPLIKYSVQAHDINVTCSISHVFPLTFPKLTSFEGNGTTETNEDGTYNTSVSHLFPLTDNDTNIQCLYSNANYKSVSSLLITDRAGQSAVEDQVPQSRSCPTDRRCKSSGLWIVCLVFVLEIFTLIITVFVIRTGRISAILQATHATRQFMHGRTHHKETLDKMKEFSITADQTIEQSKNGRMEHHGHDEETQEEMEEIISKNDQPVSQDDKNEVGPLWPVIVIAILVTVIILLAVYLGTTIASKE